MTGQQQEGIMRVGDLASRPGVSVDGPPSLWEGATLFHGAFWNRELRHGLFVHGSDVVEDEGFTALSSQHAGLSCVFFLHGDVDVQIGDRDLRFRGDGALREALVIPSARAESFRRRSLGRQRIKHLVLSVTPEWLDCDGLENTSAPRRVTSFASDHLASHAWQVSARIAELVNRLFLPVSQGSRIGELHAESIAVEIIAEALAASSGDRVQARSEALAPRERARLERARDFIRAHEGEWPGVEAVARQAGVSASGLQRLFHAAYGISVFEFLRVARLERAKEMLALGECTIQEAASVSGYSNAANFATAFRRHFGMTPKQAATRRF